MAQATFKGAPLTLSGTEVRPGQTAPDFTVIDTGLQPVRLSGAKGKVVIVCAVPSLDMDPEPCEHPELAARRLLPDT